MKFNCDECPKLKILPNWPNVIIKYPDKWLCQKLQDLVIFDQKLEDLMEVCQNPPISDVCQNPPISDVCQNPPISDVCQNPPISDVCSICFNFISINHNWGHDNHFFHKQCIDQWYRRNKTCPLCRSS